MSKDWYRNATVYGVDISRFYDSSGSGVGDIRGVIEKLDYIHSLGVDTLWLLPFFPSDRRDNGYDVTDYKSIDKELGTLTDFKQLVDEAHKRQVKVIIELVVHHSSSEHEWFKQASSDRNSKYHDYYAWSDEKIDDPDDQPIFTGEEDSVWTYAEGVGAYYHHKFYHFEPDLNVANDDVWREIEGIIDFWVGQDIDGFRLDAATHLFAKKGIEGTAVNAGKYMQELRRSVDERREGVVLLAEADVQPSKLRHYFEGGNRMHMLYNFLMNNSLFLAIARQEAAPITDRLHQLQDITDTGTWMNFLRNLDEIDLDQLSEPERQEVFNAFAPEPSMRIFGSGIRRSLPAMFGEKQLRMAYSLLFSLPGVPMITYGSEIGMGDDLSLPGRESVRLPMQWNGGQNGGFSSTSSGGTVLQSVQDEGAFSYKEINVANQEANPDSLLHFFRRLIQCRKRYPEIGHTGSEKIETHDTSVVAIQYENLLTLHNLSSEKKKVDISIPNEAKAVWGEALENTTLGPFGFSWIDMRAGK